MEKYEEMLKEDSLLFDEMIEAVRESKETKLNNYGK